MNVQKRKVAVFGALNIDIGGLPEAAFMYVGGIDQAREQAEKIAFEAKKK